MSKPIEGCPQPETPIRERAWTAEQEKSAETQALIEAYLDWDEAREGVCTNLECFKAGAAYAAALRQQADRGDGVVPDGWDGEAYANMAGELESWKRRALQAEHFIEHEVQGQTFMGEPLLRAPAEQGGRVDERKFSDEDIRLALDYSRNYATARPDISPTAKEHVLGLCNRLESLLADRAALAQNAQGEAVVFLYRHVVDKTWRDCDETDADAYSQTGCHEVRKLYTHAERARVPGGAIVVGSVIDEDSYGLIAHFPNGFPYAGTLYLAAAPSQPEDAGQ